MGSSRRGLAAGALIGLVLALSGAVEGTLGRSAPDVLVRVSGAPIRRADVDAALVRLGVEATADAAVRQAVLDRLVDEALLVERAQETGLIESDLTVRKAVIRAVIDTVVAEAAAMPTDEAALRAFHANNAALFTAPRLVRVGMIHFRDASSPAAARARAALAAAAIGGGLPFDEAARRFGDPGAAPASGALVPEAVLRRQLGPALADAALALAAGEISAPVEAQGALHLVMLVESRPSHALSIDEARGAVEAELMRRRSDDALRGLRERLRARGNVAVAPGVPRP